MRRNHAGSKKIGERSRRIPSNPLNHSVVRDGDLYLGFDDGAGGWLADAAIRIDGVTDIDALQNQNGLLFA
jgi:hypothetical protein